MRLTRRQLRKLIREAFIVDPKGNTRYLGSEEYGQYDNDSHDYADSIMHNVDYGDDKIQSTIDTLYIYGDNESKKQAVTLASSLGAISGDDETKALFDLDVASNPKFDDIKARAGRVDLTLLKRFCDALYQKGELFSADPKKPPSDIYDIIEKFKAVYPNEPEPDEQDLMDVGVDVYGGDLYVFGYTP